MKRLDLLDIRDEKVILILDGAMGSLLQQYGAANDKYLWSSIANLRNPGIVKKIHREYIDAGADIITTNTFRTNPAAVKMSGKSLSIEEFVKKSVNLAIEAREERKIVIAGSNAPAEDCYQKERTLSKSELEYNHKKHIELLWESGADIIWNETQSHLDEIEIICGFCNSQKLPYVINLFFDGKMNLLSGESLSDAVELVASFDPIAVGFNCIKPKNFLNKVKPESLVNEWGFYLNCGSGDYTDESISCGINPDHYIDLIKPLLEKKPLYAGSCCGSTPAHTKAIKEYIDEVYRN
ncbi:homocysteine S-methyltransferase family protein [Melioribacter sp. Ez-97]|uniref:homocysteine S-methyltransferase family protein n=1 Tax=Melioribacter sp. Ez-97 TaxID=3423434 RepID=UPI003ED9010B